MATPTNPEFEALAEKLGAKHEPEPLPPLKKAVIKGRGGIPAKAVEKLEEIAAKGPRAPVNPFGANVEVSEDE